MHIKKCRLQEYSCCKIYLMIINKLNAELQHVRQSFHASWLHPKWNSFTSQLKQIDLFNLLHKATTESALCEWLEFSNESSLAKTKTNNYLGK